MWSCGIILYALLCGRLPFDDEHMPRLLKKIQQGFFTVPSSVGAMERELIEKIVTVDPTRRYTTRDIFNHPWIKSKGFRDSMLDSSLQSMSSNRTAVPKAEQGSSSGNGLEQSKQGSATTLGKTCTLDLLSGSFHGDLNEDIIDFIAEQATRQHLVNVTASKLSSVNPNDVFNTPFDVSASSSGRESDMEPDFMDECDQCKDGSGIHNGLQRTAQTRQPGSQPGSPVSVHAMKERCVKVLRRTASGSFAFEKEEALKHFQRLQFESQSFDAFGRSSTGVGGGAVPPKTPFVSCFRQQSSFLPSTMCNFPLHSSAKPPHRPIALTTRLDRAMRVSYAILENRHHQQQ